MKSNRELTRHSLGPILTEELLSLYDLSNEEELYRYLYIKCSIDKGRKKVSDRELLEFTIDELNIKIHNDGGAHLVYKNEKHSFYELLSEFIDNLIFRANMFGEIDLTEQQDKVFRKGYSKSAKYRDLADYKDYIKYNRILALNEIFEVNGVGSVSIDGFDNGANRNPFRRSLEERLEASLAANRFLGSQTTAHVSEEVVEDFIVENIEIIENGMKYIDRQVGVSGGIIDILAMDRDENICVIEVKIKHDKSIVWQAMHYPNEVRKIWPRRKVRMITVSPSYNEYVLKELKRIDEVETKTYNIEVMSDNIEGMTIHDI